MPFAGTLNWPALDTIINRESIGYYRTNTAYPSNGWEYVLRITKETGVLEYIGAGEDAGSYSVRCFKG